MTACFVILLKKVIKTRRAAKRFASRSGFAIGREAAPRALNHTGLQLKTLGQFGRHGCRIAAAQTCAISWRKVQLLTWCLKRLTGTSTLTIYKQLENVFFKQIVFNCATALLAAQESLAFIRSFLSFPRSGSGSGSVRACQ